MTAGRRPVHDLVFRRATVVDGTGDDRCTADVAVTEGTIDAVGPDLPGTGREEIDAGGRVLAPGFIDPHTHLDANLFWDPDLTPSSTFGITTVVTSNCGYALAPVDDHTLDYVVATMSTVEQIPRRSIQLGVPFDWTDLPSYVARIAGLEVALNHAFLVGHVPIRAAAMGVPDVHERAATADEIAAMTGLVAQGLELGALGFSTDQVIGNIGPGGTALPGQVCGEDELLAVAGALGDGPGPGLLAMANAAMLGDRQAMVADFRWHERLAARSGRPVVVGPVFDALDDPGAGPALLDAAVAGRRDGTVVVPQISTRPFELWTRLDAPGLLVRALPTLASAVRDGAAGVRRLAADAGGRAALRDEGSRMAPSPAFSGRWDHVVVRHSLQPDVVGRNLDALAAERRQDPVDLLVDLALADDFETQVATIMRNADDDQLAAMVAHPAAMIGASDAGAHILANTDSCYAVWTLQHWVRERGVLPLERAVAKLTGDQARLLGLHDRGLIRPGLAADLVLFDPDRIGTTGVRFVDDQPGDGRRVVTTATGIDVSVVNGVVVLRDGGLTGARPGRLLRPSTS